MAGRRSRWRGIRSQWCWLKAEYWSVLLWRCRQPGQGQWTKVHKVTLLSVLNDNVFVQFNRRGNRDLIPKTSHLLFISSQSRNDGTHNHSKSQTHMTTKSSAFCLPSSHVVLHISLIPVGLAAILLLIWNAIPHLLTEDSVVIMIRVNRLCAKCIGQVCI